MSARTKKISLIINGLGAGGAERVFQTLANHWTGQGHDVQLFDMAGQESAYELHPSIKRTTLSAGLAGRFGAPGRLWGCSRDLATHLIRFSPDVSLSALARANIVHVRASRLVGAHHPVLLSERNVTALTYPGHTPRGRAMRALIRSYYPKSSRVVAISERVKRSLVEVGVPADHIRVVYNPVDLDDIRARVAVPVGVPARRAMYRIVYVGRLEPVKNVGRLLRLLARVNTRCDTELLVVGAGRQKSALAADATRLGVAERVIWAGWQPNPMPFLASADLLVHAPEHEGLGNLLIEAIAVGTPVVCMRCPSAFDEVFPDPGTGGIVCPAGDEDGFTRTCVDVLTDLDRLQRLRAGGLRRAQDFAVQRIADHYLADANA